MLGKGLCILLKKPLGLIFLVALDRLQDTVNILEGVVLRIRLDTVSEIAAELLPLVGGCCLQKGETMQELGLQAAILDVDRVEQLGLAY